ncbi:MAG: CRTAC1 family protein [Myxococcota bacterium]
MVLAPAVRSVVCPAAFRVAVSMSLAACGAKEQEEPRFPPPEIVLADATMAAGLPDEATNCVGFADFDGDGSPDLVLGVDEAGGGRVDVYRNTGGAFERAAQMDLMGSRAFSCAAGDFDGDGDPDLVVGLGPPSILLLRNTGDFTFEDLSARAPAIPPENPPALAVSVLAFVDYDADGWLDLYVAWAWSLLPDGCEKTEDDFICRATERTDRVRGLLLHNDAGETFVAAGDAPVDPPSGGLQAQGFVAAGFVDWDEDGRVDVLVTHEYGPNVLYRNVDGTGEFEAVDIGLAEYNHGMGVALGDFDGDGRWDAYVADLGPDQFYFSRDDGTVEDRAADLGVSAWTRYHSGWSPIAADFNQDGFLDLFVANTALMYSSADLVTVAMNDRVEAPGRQADFVYQADQNGGFDLVAIDHPAGSIPIAGSASTAVADVDGDGDLDVAEYWFDAQPRFRLLRNETQGAGRWLTLRLRGTMSNTSAFGADVRLIADGRPFARRFVHGWSGALGQSWPEAHFGLGARDAVDAVEIRWPSGTVQTLDGPVEAGQVVEVVEP